MSRRELWQHLAVDLGFEFKPGLDGFLQSSSGRIEMQERIARGEFPPNGLELLKTPMLRAVIEKLFEGVIVGTHRGHPIDLFPSSSRTSSSSSTTLLSNVVMPFQPRYALGLRLYNETFLSRLGKVLFFQQDVQLGHEELDRLVMIKANDERAVRALLDSRAVRDTLVQMFKASSGWEIADDAIKYKEVVDVLSRDHAIALMDRMADLAEALPPP